MQDFATLKSDLIFNGEIFEDPDFPCERDSLFYTREEDRDKELENVAWKRPKEIVEDPKFMVEGASQCDFCQGCLGDCWFLSAAATLATCKPLLRRVVPPGQTFEDGDYAGIFLFRFWRYGKWDEVIIDDRLPVNTEDNSLYFVCNKKASNEFWAALLEKAYAKLHGSYQALSGGLPHDALVDFTGGVTEYVSPLPKEPADKQTLYHRLLRFQNMQTLMATGVFVKRSGKMEEKLDSGIVAGHAYSITKIIEVTVKEKEVKLLRLRNPWGQKEWTGAWSDESEEWKDVSDDEKTSLGLVKEDDGEFWMEFNDFCEHFDMIDICHIGLESKQGKTRRKRWHMTSYHGAWIKGVTAGGTRVFEEKPLPSDETDPYWSNPQYVLVVKDPDPESPEATTTLIVSLLQKHRRLLRTVLEKDRSLENWMGFDLLRVPVKDVGDLVKGGGAMAVAERVEYSLNKEPRPYREISTIWKVPPGLYCLVVSYGREDHYGEYLLRIATETPMVSRELDTPTTAYLRLKRRGDRFTPLFKKISGEDELADANEVMEIMGKGILSASGGMTLETARLLIAVKDATIPGKLNYEEAKQVWRTVTDLANAFDAFDADGSGNIGVHELMEVFNDVGVEVSTRVARCIAYRYGSREGKVGMNDFIQCTLKITQLCDIYKQVVMQMMPPSGVAAMDLEEWLEILMKI